MADPIEPAGIVGPVDVTRIINATEISRKIQKKLIIWTTFSVLIGSFPIILNLLILFAQDKPINFFDLFAHGELLLISIAIAAGAMGDMIYSKRFERVRDIASICICFIIILFSISWFASLGIGERLLIL